jgi:hypothetical protein
MRERRETVLPEPEGHSRTAFPPASSVFLRSHMYAYCSAVRDERGKQTWVYFGVWEKDRQFIDVESNFVNSSTSTVDDTS